MEKINKKERENCFNALSVLEVSPNTHGTNKQQSHANLI